MIRRGYHICIGFVARRLFVVLLLTISIGTSVCGEEKSTGADQLTLGRQLLESGNLSEAVEVLEQIPSSEANYKAARIMLVTCYRFIGIEYYGQSRCDDAIVVWRKALGLEPENSRIEEYIRRCESESKAIARITGDSLKTAEQPLAPQEAVPVRVDTVFVPRKIEAHTPTDSTAASPPVAMSAPISIGLSTGIAIGTGDSKLPGGGTTLAGSLSILPTKRRFGARLDGIYARWYRNSDGATMAASHRTVSGLSVSAVLHSATVRGNAIQLGAGMGVYEVILTEPTVDPLGSITRRSSVVGIPLGLRLHRDLGPVAAALEARYTYLYSSLTPNLLQFTVGVASN